jgi:uncharacterized protein YjiS (DUF1127 family)
MATLEMQPQARSRHGASAATVAVAVPDQSAISIGNTIGRIRNMRIWPAMREWVRLWRTRRELRTMSQREIADFCPKLTDALREADKPFWRP